MHPLLKVKQEYIPAGKSRVLAADESGASQYNYKRMHLSVATDATEGLLLVGKLGRVKPTLEWRRSLPALAAKMRGWRAGMHICLRINENRNAYKWWHFYRTLWR
jgi:hypothetical protein